jgi:electron transport complex protein RnfC
MPIPASVTIPMSMHIGAPAAPKVKIGDTVKVGQVIAEASGFVSSPVHASVSGKIKKIEEIVISNGRKVPAITIESDGKMERYEGLKPPVIQSSDDFLQALTDSGIVGLGGAGFPTSVKLNVKNLNQIDAVIVNGAECEPYITSDTRTMLDNPKLVIAGARLLQEHLQVKRIIFAIEDNKPQCIDIFRQLVQAETGMEVMSLPSLYPQGGEKVMIYNTIGKIVPEGKLPLDVGAIVINCTTLASIARYIGYGIPLIKKCVTVDGSAVKTPKNVIAPIGASLADVFAFCDGFKKEPKKVIYGGPMMGIAVPNLEQPILKNTNAVLAFAEEEAAPRPFSPCIRCGRCVAVCPMSLTPCEVENAFDRKDMELLASLKINICMECGCCSYVCPSSRPLVQTHRLAKPLLAAYWKEQKEKEAAKK